jgi:hypothetical protein
VWAAEEYDKLLTYDGSIAEQAAKKAFGLFMCHQQDGKICAGWVGAHKPENLLAIRVAKEIDPSVWAYKSPVPLFRSGAAACAHGKRALSRPGQKAKSTIARILRNRTREAANPTLQTGREGR